MRGLINPWFATATGVMIAASLWVYHPHAQLKLPASALGRTHCTTDGCIPVTGSSKQQSLSTGGERLRKPRGNRHSGRAAGKPEIRVTPLGAGATVGYRHLTTWPGSVMLLISVPGKARENWALAFTLPGDKIVAVNEARWRPSGQDGGTASALPHGSSWDTGDGQGDGRPIPDGIEFIVLATGRSTVPAQCVLDGKSCTFRVDRVSRSAR